MAGLDLSTEALSSRRVRGHSIGVCTLACPATSIRTTAHPMSLPATAFEQPQTEVRAVTDCDRSPDRNRECEPNGESPHERGIRPALAGKLEMSELTPCRPAPFAGRGSKCGRAVLAAGHRPERSHRHGVRESPQVQFGAYLSFHGVLAPCLDVTWGNERCHRLPARCAARQAGDPSPVYPGQSTNIRQVTRRRQTQAQGFNGTLGERLPRRTNGALGLGAEAARRPDQDMVQVPVAIEIQRM